MGKLNIVSFILYMQAEQKALGEVKSALSQQLPDTNTDRGKWGDSLDGMLGPHRGSSRQGPWRSVLTGAWEISQPLVL